MGVTVDVEGLEKLRADFEKINVDDIMRKSADKIMEEMLKEVIKATPVGHKPVIKNTKIKVTGEYGTKKSFLTAQAAAWYGYRGGTLRRGWMAAKETPSFVHNGNVYSLTVTNSVYYSDYVDLGHRQQKGRYVPAIGKRLVRSYVPGQQFTTRAEDAVQPKAEKVVNKLIERALQDAVSQE
jgi:hypothetical protein